MTKESNQNTKDSKIRQLPYGLTDYELIRRVNYYYIDKTSFLPALESAGRYLFFIRPRRFGKSLFISLLKAYYDVAYKDRFEELFKGTWIYEHPTEERGTYLVLKFNFSAITSQPGFLEASLLSHVQKYSVDFIGKYDAFLSANPEKDYFIQKIKESRMPSDILESLQLLCAGAHQKLYVFIDEYDNFANTILTDLGTDAYHKLTHGAGIVRTFFNVLKSGTTDTEAPVTRSFITGVSPITMDDVTSGYNIGENVSLDGAFNQMMGFTGDEVTGMLDYYSAQGLLPPDTGEIHAILEKWYGNYLFSGYGNKRMYNPDMVLYFLKEYFKTRKLPEDLIDHNVKIDYGKLHYLIIIDKENRPQTNGNFSRLKEIIEKGEIFALLKKAFPLSELTDQNSFISLLFYFGLLTIDDPEPEPMKLGIPNETIRHLFYEYIKKGYTETGVFSLELSNYDNLLSDMSKKGEWEPLFQFITKRMKESLSLRDLITGEKAVQTFLNVYLGLSNRYILHTEKELNKGYADILMEPFLARYEDIQYSYMIEIKYIKRAAAETDKKPPTQEVKKLVAEAERQLQHYSLDEKLTRALGKTTLIKLVLVFCGHEAVYIGEMGQT